MVVPHIDKLTWQQDDDPGSQVTIPGGSLSGAAEVQWDGSSGTGSLQVSDRAEPGEDTSFNPVQWDGSSTPEQ